MPNSFRLEASISAGARAGLESCRIMPSCPRADGLGTQRPKRMRQPCPQLCRCLRRTKAAAVPSRMLVGISGVISGKLKVPDQAARSIC